MSLFVGRGLMPLFVGRGLVCHCLWAGGWCVIVCGQGVDVSLFVGRGLVCHCLWAGG